MAERNSFHTKVDRYLRKEDTILAKTLQVMCSLEGQKYRESSQKRVAELAIAIPMAVATLPIMGVLALIAKLEDGGSAFYVRDRIGKNGEPTPLAKIRCMKEDADNEPWVISHQRNQTQGEASDSRNTHIGRFMRQYELEELPQLWQVIQGTIGLVDIRAVAQYAADYMEEKMGHETFEIWLHAYMQGRPGLFSLNTALNNHRKDDTKRSPFDLLYAKKASLGLDLFVLYRIGLRMGEKLVQKVPLFKK